MLGQAPAYDTRPVCAPQGVFSLARDFDSDVAAVGRIDAVTSILDVLCRSTGMGFAAVARVTEDRWIACAVKDDIAFGLKPGGELKVETTICDAIRDSRQPVVIDHVAEDADYRNHHTPAMYGFQSYISMPIIRADGSFFGTLCAIDPHPRSLKRSEIIESFRLFAQLIAFHLDSQDHVATTEAALVKEREAASLRDQFIAVLGHDLRNPLASVDAGVKLLRKEPLGGRAPAILGLVEKSVSRMAELIDNVLDLARGRLGGGLKLERNADAELDGALEQVANELRSAWPGRTIATDFEIDTPVSADRSRIAQLLSNLVGNALTHGAPDQPVRVRAVTTGGQFLLSVSNQGEAISPEAMEQLFQPFFRGEGQGPTDGLGLGLYIASEIAKAHGGALDVASSPEETRFTFLMPLA
jgi:signal transduction histidine kinase